MTDAVVVDANVVLAICSHENLTYKKALTAFEDYAKDGWEFHAPNVLTAEVLFVLCRKLADGVLSKAEHDSSIEAFTILAGSIRNPENGDGTLISSASKIRGSYGCSRMSDSLYLAYAQELAANRKVEILTFDNGLINHAANCSATFTVRVLS